jgi:hypothetical protein
VTVHSGSWRSCEAANASCCRSRFEPAECLFRPSFFRNITEVELDERPVFDAISIDGNIDYQFPSATRIEPHRLVAYCVLRARIGHDAMGFVGVAERRGIFQRR